MVKLFATGVTQRCTDATLEIFDGIGCFEDNPYVPLERLYRDCRALCWRRALPPSSA